MEENVTAQNPFGTEKIGKLMVRYEIPSILSLVVNSLYNIVDQIFIGQGVGYLGNAATNVINPLSTIGMALSTMIGSGAMAYMSLNMGKGENKKAARGAGNMLIMAVIVGVVLMVLAECFMVPLCRLFGATEDSLSYALDYGRVIALGFPFTVVGIASTNFVRTDGRPMVSMGGMLIGCAFNIVFDPIFIFVFHWGVKGAALATILGQIVSAIFTLVYMMHPKTIRFGKDDLALKKDVIGQISVLGMSSFITQATLVLVSAITNNLLVHYGALSKYGADIPLAAFGITMKISMIANSVVLGMVTGIQPVLGYNYGNGKYDRVKKIFFYNVIISTLVLAVADFVFQMAPESIVAIFGNESELYTEFAIKCLSIFMLLCFLKGIPIATSTLFQSIGKPGVSMILSLLRDIVVLIPAAFLMTYLIGVEGMLWAGVISDGLSAVISAVILLGQWKKIFKKYSEFKEVNKNG